MPLEKVTLLCFGASYALALAFELARLIRRGGDLPRLLAVGCGAAGLVAHTIFLAVQRPGLSSRFGTLVFLAWILAVFYLYGSLHHRRIAWGIFVLPLVLGLVLLAAPFDRQSLEPTQGDRFWVWAHLGLLLLSAVGVCVAFVASVMYLVQARRLRAKMLPGEGMPLLSLERLEEMNRHGILLAFPLLTAGLVIGAALVLENSDRFPGWGDPKVIGALALWLVFAILLYLRYNLNVFGRRAALLTIMAFALLLLTLVTPVHTYMPGGGP